MAILADRANEAKADGEAKADDEAKDSE